LSDARTNQTIKSWVIVVRGAAGEHNALVRARVKARQHAAYEPGDRIEVEIAKPKPCKVANPSHTGTAKVELANDIRGGRNVGNLWGVARYTVDGRRGSYLLQPQRSESVARAFASHWNSDQRHENPSRRAIDHKFAGALFSAGHPKTALAYLRGTLTKSTARELAAGKKRR